MSRFLQEVALWLGMVAAAAAIVGTHLYVNERCQAIGWDGAPFDVFQGEATCFRYGSQTLAVEVRAPLWMLEDGWRFHLLPDGPAVKVKVKWGERF